MDEYDTFAITPEAMRLINKTSPKTETETAIAVSPPPALPVVSGDIDVDVVAETPEEMRSCQEALIVWAKAKVAASEAEAKELHEAYEQARSRKWKSDTLKRHAEIADKRAEFHRKLLAALEAGYHIVPSFPITAFAVRREGNPKKPTAMFSISTQSWMSTSDFQQLAKPVPAGEGEYFNPFPVVMHSQATPTPEGQKQYQRWADRWAEMEFPISMAKPQIIHATNRAMALKIFDEIGICPADTKSTRIDPMIIGRIRDPRPPLYGEARHVSFIIAWRLNTRDL